MNLLDRQLLFVTGKGGVGKTTVAAALAQLAAQHGKHTLVCEMDAKGSLAAAFDCSPFPYTPRPVDTDLFGMAMNTEDSLREYLKLFIRIPFVGRIGPLARTFDFVADAAPGVQEILAIGKLCYEVRERNYDLVVVDAEATGHIIGQIGAPRVISELVQVGLVKDQTKWMLDILEDPVRTGLVTVTTPEEMPVNETIDLLAQVAERTKVDSAAIIVNRVLPALFGTREAQVFDQLFSAPAKAALVKAAGKHVVDVMEAARMNESRRRIGDGHLDHLRESLEASAAPGSVRAPMLYIPELFTRATGRRVVTLVAEALAEEIG
ncbi:MAG: putative anion transporting ATPase [Ilumatobacteraceae bacterium]|nr:putative anion transporting ATPase [Ilumatobacteraceae bacterium]